MAVMRRQSQQWARQAATPKALHVLLFVATSVVILFPRRYAFVASEAGPARVAALQRRDAVNHALRLWVGALTTSQILPSSVQATPVARWSGRYGDLQHPGCERRIVKQKDKFIIAGESATDGSKGCDEGTPTATWTLEAQKVGVQDAWSGPGNELTIDFSSVGGSKSTIATWDKDAILFPGGNKWKKRKAAPSDSWRPFQTLL